MKITKDFCELSRFLQINAGLTCRAKCHNCKKAWGKTGTQFVNRAVGIEIVNGKPIEKVFYLCTTCVLEIETSNQDTLQNTCM